MFEQQLQEKLAKLKAQHRYRARRVIDSPQQPRQIVDGKPVISFCSNDYLGLANHPDVVSAFKHAADEYGVGSGASQLINGHSRLHHELEDQLADFFGRDRVLLFSTGYMANLGVVSALTNRHDAIFEDKLNHASLIDAAMLSRANLARYAHQDVKQLNQLLSQSNAKLKLVISDAVFSMDGDITDLEQLVSISQKNDAVLMLDDAHGIGVLGEQGRGTLSMLGQTQQDIPIMVGTLGKAFGTFGAFVAGSEVLIETLIQSARSYIYTTAMPAAIAAATLASLKLVKEEEYRLNLFSRINQFKQGCEQLDISLTESKTPIQPLIVGSDEQAVAISQALLDEGILVQAIRPPTVPEGTARLRITFSASHTEQQVNQLIESLHKIINGQIKKVG